MNAFISVVGQDAAVNLLQSAIAKQRIAPAYLFVGPSGIGKSLTAQAFIEALFCHGLSEADALVTKQRLRDRNHPDVLWIEPTYSHQGQRLTVAEAAEAGLKRKTPPQIAISQIRDLNPFLGRPPLWANRSLVAIDQAQTMAEAAANALLKTLEEPGKATLILIAPSVSALLPTIISRCAVVPFYRLGTEAMAKVLKRQAYGNLLERPEILALAQGSPGEAIAAWEQMQAIPPNLLEKLATPPQTCRSALELAKDVDKILDTEAQLWLIDYLQQSYWRKNYPVSLLQALETARRQLLSYANPRLVWEVMLMGMCA
ncbi:MAG: DNA polymerase III subunit delta' [Desertifilum sp. SIO1I2]|nr:DNA polymerase III subunit delta' [Desertifilum sp. SIO1I2]